MEDKVKDYVKELEEYSKQKDGKFYSTFDYTKGQKFYKVWEYLCNKQKCIFCFIDENGNIYKPQGINNMAKGVRGNLDAFRPLEIGQVYKRR